MFWLYRSELKKCVTVFDADKFFMFDMDKHYFVSKLITDMSVYVGPTYLMYVCEETKLEIRLSGKKLRLSWKTYVKRLSWKNEKRLNGKKRLSWKNQYLQWASLFHIHIHPNENEWSLILT